MSFGPRPYGPVSGNNGQWSAELMFPWTQSETSAVCSVQNGICSAWDAVNMVVCAVHIFQCAVCSMQCRANVSMNTIWDQCSVQYGIYRAWDAVLYMVVCAVYIFSVCSVQCRANVTMNTLSVISFLLQTMQYWVTFNRNGNLVHTLVQCSEKVTMH